MRKCQEQVDNGEMVCDHILDRGAEAAMSVDLQHVTHPRLMKP